MLNSEQRKELAKRLAERLREDDEGYITDGHKQPEQWSDHLRNDLEAWITEFNNEI